MTDRLNHNGSAENDVSEEMVQLFFDRELGEGASDEFFTRLRGNLPRCAEVAKMQRAISLLREPIESPDVAERVLQEVHQQRRFLPERVRRFVTAGRLAAAGVALAGVLGLVVVDRYAPGALRLTPRARPVSDVVACTTGEAEQGVTQLAAAVTTIRVLAGPPAVSEGGARASVALKPRSSFMDLRPGVTSAKVLPTLQHTGDETLVVYRGAGPDTRFILPEVVFIDRNAAIVMPLGHMSPSRIGSKDWAGVSMDNLFLLPAFDPAGLEGSGIGKAGVAKPAGGK